MSHPAESLAPSSTHPAAVGAVCSCGAGPHAEASDRCAAGHVVRGNVTARRHGLHASALATAVLAERRAFLDASLADDGGADEAPTRRRSLHEYRARLHVQIGALSDAIEQHGMFDRRGRLRSLWLQRLEGLITTAHRLDSTLGLARRARQVPSLDDELAAIELTEDGDA